METHINPETLFIALLLAGLFWLLFRQQRQAVPMMQNVNVNGDLILNLDESARFHGTAHV